jgi:RHS repeat-associated protein
VSLALRYELLDRGLEDILQLSGQYTSIDTGLIYLRARVYDPGAAQFLSVDPLATVTGALYTYADDNPLTYGGLFLGIPGTPTKR